MVLVNWCKEIKKIISNYKNKFLLKLINWGDADMINFFNHPMNLFFHWPQIETL